MTTDYARLAADAARLAQALPEEEHARLAAARQAAERRQAFAAHLRGLVDQFNEAHVARWLAHTQTYAPANVTPDAVVAAFVEAEGGGLQGWAQVWTEYATLLRTLHAERENLLDRR